MRIHNLSKKNMQDFFIFYMNHKQLCVNWNTIVSFGGKLHGLSNLFSGKNKMSFAEIFGFYVYM